MARPRLPERQKALREGLPTYSGSNCKRCGYSIRYTGCGSCKHCNHDRPSNPKRQAS